MVCVCDGTMKDPTLAKFRMAVCSEIRSSLCLRFGDSFFCVLKFREYLGRRASTQSHFGEMLKDKALAKFCPACFLRDPSALQSSGRGANTRSSLAVAC